MRLSVRKDDPGYSRHSYRAKVFVDGKEVHHCFTADEETGEAFCHATENGLFVHENGDIKVVVLKGKVEIVLLKKEDHLL